MSAIMRKAFQTWQEMRDDFELMRHAQYERAHEELNGVLLNRRGREAGIDPYSLFMGSELRAVKYASWELVAWWHEDSDNHRPTVEHFEKQWLAQREAER